MDPGKCRRKAWRVGCSPGATAPLPQSGAVVERIAAAYELRFAQYVRVATAISGDRERGRDAVQDAFAQAIAGCLAYRGDGPLEAWLWRAVTNAARNQRRGGRSLVPVATLQDELGQGSAPGGDEDAAVRRHLAALPERQRLVLFLRYYADLSYSEIGEVLGLRTGTVSATLAAAHRTLRGRLEPVAA
jgi:RNA polymerase sigma factor (sigma-70 family)